MGKKERRVETYLTKKIKELGGLCYKWRAVDISGVPDRVAMLPWMGIFLVEVKTKNGKTSRAQENMFAQMKEAGGVVFICQGIEGVDKLIEFVIKVRDGKQIRNNS